MKAGSKGVGGGMATFHTDQIGMHYNEAVQFTNSMFSKAQQQTCAGESVYLWVCGLSKPEVLINKCTNIGSICVWVSPIMACCNIKLTGPPIITDKASASQSAPPAETRKKEGVQLLWSHVLMCSSCCCLNMSLFCPCYIFPPQSLSMIRKCHPPPLSLPLIQKLFWLAEWNWHLLSTSCNFLTTYMIHACFWQRKERVERLRLIRIRASSTVTDINW